MNSDPLRPRDFALLLLASGETTPRERARDQAADRTGLALKRRILEQLVAVDPEPEDLEAVLLELPQQMGESAGTTRSLSLALLQEWQLARTTPAWVAHLLDTAIAPENGKGLRRGRQLPG